MLANCSSPHSFLHLFILGAGAGAVCGGNGKQGGHRSCPHSWAWIQGLAFLSPLLTLQRSLLLLMGWRAEAGGHYVEERKS